MNKVSFAKTFIPKDKYQDVVYKDNRVLVHFSPKQEDDCITCIECSVPIEGFTSEAVKSMYDAYVAEQQEKDLFYAKNNKLAEINEYDKSNEVNTFFLNESPRWLNYEERSKIYEGNERLRIEGRTNTTIWIGTERFDSTIEAAQKLISQLDSYLTKNDGELVKVTVAVKHHYKQWLYKQVAVHGLNSDRCFVKSNRQQNTTNKTVTIPKFLLLLNNSLSKSLSKYPTKKNTE